MTPPRSAEFFISNLIHRAGGHPLQRVGAQQRRDGDEGFEGEGGRGDDDSGAVVVQGPVLGGKGVPLPGGERGGRKLSSEGEQGACGAPCFYLL